MSRRSGSLDILPKHVGGCYSSHKFEAGALEILASMKIRVGQPESLSSYRWTSCSNSSLPAIQGFPSAEAWYTMTCAQCRGYAVSFNGKGERKTLRLLSISDCLIRFQNSTSDEVMVMVDQAPVLRALGVFHGCIPTS